MFEFWNVMEFRFKQFSVFQSKEVFKISTDSVLLGAWAELENVKTVLEIGTGTGVIALMLAQRFDAEIKSIDIQETAVVLAQKNFENSPWVKKLSAAHEDFLQLDEKQTFDAIVSNPPFFENALQSANQSKMMARHLDHLPLPLFAEKVAKLLRPEGVFVLIMPPDTFENMEQQLALHHFFLQKECNVRSFESGRIIRKMGIFSRGKKQLQQEDLFLYKNKTRERSEQYHSLTKDFYL